MLLYIHGPEPDGVRLELVFGKRLREDLDYGQAGFEQRLEGVLQFDGDGLGVFGLDRLDELEERAVGRICHVLIDGVHDVVGSHFVSVGEFRAVTQCDFVLGVGNLGGLVSGKRVVGLVSVQVEVVGGPRTHARLRRA